ncbi:MAG: ABC transporter ATP-binding protein [Dehalococcoidia bacterium]|nr:MAG: ABC transporter ATP-binding protein [Dehalococcoidia bacterium]
MLSVTGLSQSYDGHELFSEVTFTVGMSDRIAVLGRNGSGKTTLFEIITGNIMPDSGSVSLRRDTTIGYLRQDVQPLSERTLLEYVSGSSDVVTNLAHKIRLVQEDLAEEKDEETLNGLLRKLGELQSLFEARGGYSSEHEAKMVLSGLGFAQSDFGRPLPEFSGGWRTRIELARLLFLSPDILLLDEPTNYLDLETQRWFEVYLKRYHGAILVTSHDRAFLNNVVSTVIAIEDEGVIFYRGDYDSYVLARGKDIETRQAAARRQEREISRQMRFIERFRAKNTKASQVQSRIKQLEKIERITVPRSTKKIHFNFPQPPRSGRIVIELKHVAKSYGQHVVYRDLNLTLERGDRAAIVGINGAGKTTLLRMLAGVLPFEGGQRVLGHNVTTAYFAQYYVESLNPHNTIIEELRGVAPGEPEQRLRGLAGAFLFSGDDVTKNISVLSGGEKTRVAIARMLMRPASFLLLDEPTNHLDIPSREILTDALNAYKGTMCFITHDRTLIREAANKIIQVRDGRVTVFPGSYDDYLWQSGPSDREAAMIETRPGTGQLHRPATAVEKRQRKALEGRLRNEYHRGISPVKERMTRIEQELAATRERIQEIEGMMADPTHYENPQNIVAVNREYMALREKVARLTTEWENLAAEADRIDLEYRRAQEDLPG